MKWRGMLASVVLAALSMVATYVTTRWLAPKAEAVVERVVEAPAVQRVVTPVTRVVKRAMTRIRKGAWGLGGPR